MKAKTKRELKIAGFSLAVGIGLGVYLAFPSQPRSPVQRMGELVRQTNEDTDAWLAELERDLGEPNAPPGAR